MYSAAATAASIVSYNTWSVYSLPIPIRLSTKTLRAAEGGEAHANIMAAVAAPLSLSVLYKGQLIGDSLGKIEIFTKQFTRDTSFEVSIGHRPRFSGTVFE